MMSRWALILTTALLVACTPAARGREVQVAVKSTAVPAARLQQQERVIVRHAALEVEVEEVGPAVERATQLAQRFEGYVENATTREDKAAQVRLRVPSARLTEALDSLARLGKVTGRSLSQEDVTAQSVDLEARVASFRATRDKLRELLERATSVADAVAAQGELARVQAELDSLEGQLRLLQSSVALSEVTLTINRRVVLGPLGVVVSGLATLVGKLFVWR